MKNYYWCYLYFVNHVGNPLAYYAINKQFRKEVNRMVKISYVRLRCRVTSRLASTV